MVRWLTIGALALALWGAHEQIAVERALYRTVAQVARETDARARACEARRPTDSSRGERSELWVTQSNGPQSSAPQSGAHRASAPRSGP